MNLPEKTIGVYILWLDGVCQYVGQSVDVGKRIGYHDGQSMVFDKVTVLKCEPEKLVEYERWAIKKYKPVINIQGLPKYRVIKTKEPLPKPKTRGMTLRKMTLKSMIGFGHWKTKTVGWILERGESVQLAGMYFKLSHISFMDDVLDKIGIPSDFRIEKPGNDWEKWYQWLDAFHKEDLTANKEKIRRKMLERSSKVLKSIARSSTRKNYNQAYNQGHGKTSWS